MYQNVCSIFLLLEIQQMQLKNLSLLKILFYPCTCSVGALSKIGQPRDSHSDSLRQVPVSVVAAIIIS